MRAVGYLRVSTADQDYGIEVQRSLIAAEAELRGWTVVEWATDHGKTGKKIQRPGLDAARAMLERGEAETLIVAKLDRLSRSVHDFTALVREAMKPSRGKKAWSIVVLDPAIDLTTANGRLVANILMAVAEWEGDIISARTRDALAQAKSEGVHIGSRPQIDPAVVTRMRRLRAKGWSYARIASRLNADGTPTPNGKRFHGSTVNYAVNRPGR